MARTKQTAKKSTGASAPRRSLGGCLPENSPRITPLGRRPSIRIKKQQAARSKVTNTPPPTNAASGSNLPDATVGVIRDLSGNFCSICRNGGDMNICDYCPRAICKKCVLLPEDIPEDARFKCPHCFSFTDDGRRAAPRPYLGLSSSNIPLDVPAKCSQREFAPVCSAERLLVLTIKLSSIPDDGLPPVLVYQSLYPYLPGLIQQVCVSFDLSTSDGLDEYSGSIGKLASRLSSGDLKSFRRFAVFLVDHTDPESGDLHFAPNNTGASPFTEVLTALFPITLLETMATGTQNTFTLLACGGLLKCEKLVTDVKSFAQRGPFSWVMAFGQMDFQPSSANSFLMDVMLSWHIYGRSPISGMLQNHQALGSHSDIYFFYQNGRVARVTWSHPGQRPFGIPIDLQCICKSLKSYTPHVTLNQAKNDISSVRLVCKYCNHSFQILKPECIRRIRSGAWARSDIGEWYVEDM